mgnify:CR=1 FL=1
MNAVIDQWSVLAALRQYTDIGERGEAAALPLCRDSLCEVRGRLRDAAFCGDRRVETAAAGLAFYRLTLRRMGENGGAARLKAGDIAIERNPGALLAAAAKVRDEALAQAAPLLKDNAFYFGKVDV